MKETKFKKNTLKPGIETKINKKINSRSPLEKSPKDNKHRAMFIPDPRVVQFMTVWNLKHFL